MKKNFTVEEYMDRAAKVGAMFPEHGLITGTYSFMLMNELFSEEEIKNAEILKGGKDGRKMEEDHNAENDVRS